MPTSVAVVLALAALATDAPGPGDAARVAAAERELCLATCPPVPAGATSDWLRSPDGQRASGCELRCRAEQPAAAMYRELAGRAAGEASLADEPLVKLAGKEGPDLARRLRAALREARGRPLGPLCTRARERLGAQDERGYLECVGRVTALAPPAMAAPDAARALRCATAFAERVGEWLRRCPPLEARADVDGCVAGLDGPAGRRRAPRSRSLCEAEAVERLRSDTLHLRALRGAGDARPAR